MVQPVKRNATYQDVLDAPPNMVAEILAGELFLQPRPAAPHSKAASILGMLLGPPFSLGKRGPGGWEILDEPEFHFGPDILVPDLAGWRTADVADLDLTVAFHTQGPQWICEVLSPSTAGTDRVRKLPIYAESGVQHAWLIDPLARTLEVFAIDKGRWVLVGAYEGDAPVRAEPFDAIELELGELWVPAK